MLLNPHLLLIDNIIYNKFNLFYIFFKVLYINIMCNYIINKLKLCDDAKDWYCSGGVTCFYYNVLYFLSRNDVVPLYTRMKVATTKYYANHLFDRDNSSFIWIIYIYMSTNPFPGLHQMPLLLASQWIGSETIFRLYSNWIAA